MLAPNPVLYIKPKHFIFHIKWKLNLNIMIIEPMQVYLQYNLCGVEFVNQSINISGGTVKTLDVKFVMQIILLLRVNFIMLVNGVVVLNIYLKHVTIQME